MRISDWSSDVCSSDLLEAAGTVRSFGPLANCWLGVPLKRDDTVIGGIVVQSYPPEIGFGSRDQELLTFVAHHIDGALARKPAQEHLKDEHNEHQLRVEDRTREPEQPNAEQSGRAASWETGRQNGKT